jgi:hypothetical protein
VTDKTKESIRKMLARAWNTLSRMPHCGQTIPQLRRSAPFLSVSAAAHSWRNGNLWPHWGQGGSLNNGI